MGFGILGALAPIAGAGLGAMFGNPMLGASLGAGIGGWMGQQDTNSANAAMSQQQMDFQERMSSTAYQRATADMQAAGLNPMLAYSQGGASSPGGSMAQAQNSVGAGMASAGQAASTLQGVAQIAQTSANTDLVKAQIDKTRSETLDQKVATAIQLANQKEAENRAGLSGLQFGAEVGLNANTSYGHKVRQAKADADTSERRPGQVSAQTQASIQQARLTGLQADQAKATNPDRARQATAEADTASAKVAREKAYEGFYKSGMGAAEPYIDQVLRMLNGAEGVSSAVRAWLPTNVFRSVLREGGKGWTETTTRETRKH